MESLNLPTIPSYSLLIFSTEFLIDKSSFSAASLRWGVGMDPAGKYSGTDRFFPKII
jgi:hypothetical protein